jgi:hypothetical protein
LRESQAPACAIANAGCPTPDMDASWVNGRTEFEKVRHF